MKIKKAVALSTAFGIALAGIAFSTPAIADPVSNSYVLVGSDTLDASVNALANGTLVTGSFVRVTTGGNTIASFDAFPRGPITAKSAGVTFTRPEGSGAGAKALSRTIDGGAYKASYAALSTVLKGSDKSSNAVDIARESSPQGVLNDASGLILSVPYARDAVSYAIKAGSSVTSTALSHFSSLNASELKEAYYATGSPAVKTFDGATLVPKLPQSSSGTRQFFLTAIGGAKSDEPAGANAGSALPENDGTVLTPAANEIWIIPFSVASWVAQANHANPTDTTAGLTLGTPAGVAPFTGSGTSLVANSAFYYGTGAAGSTTFGRDTFLAVEYARVTAGVDFDKNLANLIDPSLSTSLTYFPTTAGGPSTTAAVKLKFGFLAPLDTTQHRYDLVAN